MTQLLSSCVSTPFSRHVPKPWGYEVILTPSALPYAAKLIHVRAGCRLSLQIHDKKTETLTLLSGQAELLLEGERNELTVYQLEEGVGYTVLAGKQHRLMAGRDSVVLEASTPEEGTTFRLQDDYSRPDEVAGSS